jgi:hypothetical protein
VLPPPLGSQSTPSSGRSRVRACDSEWNAHMGICTMPVGSFWMGVEQSSDRLLDVPKSIDHADDVLLLCNSIKGMHVGVVVVMTMVGGGGR